MAFCFHWGLSKESNCQNISKEIIYRDSHGHGYCMLHAPKYYLQPKGFFLGDIKQHNSTSSMVDIKYFNSAIEAVIKSQISNDEIRFEKIYYPDGISNSFDSHNYPDKRIYFLSCVNPPSISNSTFKNVHLSQCTPAANHFHNCSIEILTITSGNTKGNLILRDSNLDTITLSNIEIEGNLTISNIKQRAEKASWACSVYMDSVFVAKDVEISGLSFQRVNSDFRVVNSIFNKNMHYFENKLEGAIEFKHCKLEGGKVYLEAIDTSNVKLSMKNLEYIRFINCDFPESFTHIEKTGFSGAEEMYRELKKIAFEQRNYSLVSKWHFLEKEFSLRNARESKNQLMIMFLGLYRVISGYGERPFQAMKILMGYFISVSVSLAVIAVCYTGVSNQVDWNIVGKIFYSFRDFVPFFITPTKQTLLSLKDIHPILAFIYNFLAGTGRIFCLIQVGFLSVSVRNRMMR